MIPLGSLSLKKKDALKNQLKGLTDEFVNQGTEFNVTGNRLAELEFQKLDENLISWNVPCEKISDAKEQPTIEYFHIIWITSLD